MKLTWNDTIEIIKTFLDCNSTDIANNLDVNKSTINRLANGKIAKFKSYNEDEIYQKLFDPANEKGSVYNEKESSLLETLKETIENAGFKEALEDVWEEKDYKTFTTKMLKRTQNKKLLKDKSSDSKNEKADIEKNKVVYAYTPKDMEMQKIFKDAIIKYGIHTFFALEYSYEKEAERFRKFLYSEIINKPEFKEEKLYSIIQEFAHHLYAYNKTLDLVKQVRPYYKEGDTYYTMLHCKITGDPLKYLEIFIGQRDRMEILCAQICAGKTLSDMFGKKMRDIWGDDED